MRFCVVFCLSRLVVLHGLVFASMMLVFILQLLLFRTGQRPTKADIQEFVNQNFDAAGSELKNWTPPDWKELPGKDCFFFFYILSSDETYKSCGW